MSREYKGKRIVIYPIYLDSTLSRKEGRKVPLSLAIPKPTLEEIAAACEKLGLNPEIEPDKVHPKSIALRGRVVANKLESKLRTLYAVAKTIVEMRKSVRQKTALQ
ncbi:MAG: signal recognition particle subunit SRP19/SEC65 family protein [Desulfurococcaceae archaeon]